MVRRRCLLRMSTVVSQPITPFAPRGSAEEVEEGHAFAPKFDADGLVTCVATDAVTGEVLMVAHMNAEALQRTIESGEAWYYSRSRRALWRKGESSGHVQRVIEMRVDCDQDAVWIKVQQAGGGACHTGRRSCFYGRCRSGPAALRSSSATATRYSTRPPSTATRRSEPLSPRTALRVRPARPADRSRALAPDRSRIAAARPAPNPARAAPAPRRRCGRGE